MSLLQKSKKRNVGSAWERLWGSFSGERRSLGERKPRRLAIDPLEERALLSVSVVDLADKLINQAISTSQSTVTAKALASNNNGDFVVVWSRIDPVLDAHGLPVINTATGHAMTDSNIYARYFTNEVQRLVLPAGVLNDALSGQYATFSLTFGGNEVQEITLSATTASGSNQSGALQGTLQLSFTPTGGTKLTTVTINFNESTFGASWANLTTAALSSTDTTMTVQSVAALPQALTPTVVPPFSPSFTVVVDDEHILVTPVFGTNDFTIVRGTDGTTATTHALGAKVTLLDPALQIQTVLRALGGSLTDVVVKGIDSQHYKIYFGDLSGGVNQPQLAVESVTFTGGFLPAVTTSTISEPLTVSNIPISPTSPANTALAIEQAFLQLAQDYYVGPSNSALMPYNNGPTTVRIATPTVSVTSAPTANDPLGLRTFNIEFTGDSGMTDQPLLVIPAGSVLSEDGTTVLNASAISAVTLKEPSPEFRVNPEELDNPFTPLPDYFNQTNPAVAMDSQGDFVITWQSEVPNAEVNGSVSDVFARMFKPVGIVNPSDPGVLKVDMNRDGVPETIIQGVRAVESPIPYSATLSADSFYRVASDLYTFRVNELTANAQGDPSVGMDAKGNFVIAWSGAAQTLSFFNDVYKRQFSRDGTPATAIEEQINSEDTENHGNTYVALSDDGHCVILWDDAVGLELALYNSSGDLLSSYLLIPGAGGGSAAFDSNNNFTVGFSLYNDLDFNGNAMSFGYYFGELDIGGNLLRPLTRANSANWPQDQLNGQTAMDADGDLTVVYQGYGPDASTSLATGAAAALLRQIVNLPENADLVAKWPQLATLFTLPLGANNSGDTDSVIEEMLIHAQKDHGFTNLELGRLRAIVDHVADLLRGVGSAIMYSQYDADPMLGGLNVLTAGDIVNSQRDGTNTRVLIALDKLIAGGKFTLSPADLVVMLGDADVVDFGDAPDPAVPIGSARMLAGIQAALDSGAIFGGDCTVRLINDAEIAERTGTNWDLTTLPGLNPTTQFIFEVTIAGRHHDTPCRINVSTIDLNIGKNPAGNPIPSMPPVQMLYAAGTTGARKHDPSIGITPDGSYVVAWTEDDVDGAGNVVDSNMYFRRFQESANTAGPTVSQVYTPDGQAIDQDAEITASTGVQHLVISMDCPMYDNVTHTGNAVTNPANYQLLLNGSPVNGAIASVQYGLSKAADLAQMAIDNPALYGSFSDLLALPTNHYEIVLTIDANGAQAGTPGLGTGDYTLVLKAPKAASTGSSPASSGLEDAGHAALNLTGFTSASSGGVPTGVDATLDFSLFVANSNGGTSGVNMLVDQNTQQVQTTSSTANAPTTSQYNSRVIAVDHSGDFVVTWISYGQDGDSRPTLPNGSVNPNYDPNAATAAGVFMRLYDRNNNPLTGEIQVNTYSIGDQTSPVVAMDADGDFVVAWASQGQDADGSWGIYGQRFNSMGTRVGGEFHINSNYTSDQVAPAVAMNSFGQFVVVWATKGQSFSYFNNIEGQVFGSSGERLGSEFRVNSVDIPGTGTSPTSNELHPSVAMDDAGSFVVTWDAVTAQKNSVTLATIVMARVFDHNRVPVAIGGGSNAEFQVNVGDANFQADYGNTEHIQAHRLPDSNTGTPTTDSASNAQVAMDSQGNFIVTWQAFQDNDVIDVPTDVVNSYGIYYRRFLGEVTDNSGNSLFGVPDMAHDHQANLTITALDMDNTHPFYSLQQSAPFASDQVNPSIAMDADGDYFIVWNGNGATADAMDPANVTTKSDAQGVFVRSFHASGLPADANEAVTPQSRVNSTQTGYQGLASVAATPSGSYLVAWSGNGSGDSQGIYVTRQTSSVDNAGPMLTDFLLPNGTPVASNTQVMQSLQAVVITFDEEMLDNAGHTGSAASNPANYQLLKNGAAVLGGISQVLYGLDIANQLGSQYGLNVPRLNKYQAVLIVDGNGSGAGVQPLSDGQYQVVALNSLRDKVGNALQSSGVMVNGRITSGMINVTMPTGQETIVASGPTPAGATYGKYTTASTADAVAADADGDYVVAWTDTTPGHQGVFARMYEQTSTLNADGSRTTSVTPMNEFLISSDPTASDISVARDVDGDFVVTWSAWNATTDWDVFAQRFNAAGQAEGGIFRVNATTADAQRYSSVSMDAQGDFVITWQSQNQDDSGSGIYAQAYNSSGSVVGGVGEIQAIDFTGGFTGTFRLRWDDDNNSATPDKVTAPISFTGNASAALAGIKNALAAIGADVNVVANGLTEVLIQFIGASGNKDEQPLWVSAADVTKTGGGADAQVTAETISDGITGEFRVNDTTNGDQVYPDVAMDAEGNFVITWTSFNQSNDNAIQSNIYAKRYTSTSLVWDADNVDAAALQVGINSRGAVNPKVTTVDNPDNHLVNPGTGYEGVVQIFSNDYGSGSSGSGSLLVNGNAATGYWVLTAAHVIYSTTTMSPLLASAVTVAFDLPSGRVIIPAAQIVVHPGYNGNSTLGYDIGLIKLATIPTGVQGFQIYTASDEVSQVFQLMGYGKYGTDGAGDLFNPDNRKREMKNVFDATATVLGFTDRQLAYDVDDGTARRDAFGLIYGIYNTDTALVASNEEGDSCHGDSGGPDFINNKIAGIVTFGYGVPGVDIDNNADNSTFGEFGVDIRVSAFADWLNSFSNVLGQSQIVAGAEFLVNKNDVVNVATDAQGDPIADQFGNLYYIALDNESGNQSRSSVALDSDGDFVIAWTSYGQDAVGNGSGYGVNGENGVFARRYNADTSKASDVFQVNQTAQENQQNAKVSMDAAGDFIIAWESGQNGNYDIYARRYARTSLAKYVKTMDPIDPTNAFLLNGTNSVYASDLLAVNAVLVSSSGTVVQAAGKATLAANNGAIGGELLINSTTSGDQRFPSVALDGTGDAVIVWSGNGMVQGQEDAQGIFFQRIAQQKDTAGPAVGEVLNVTTSGGATHLSHVVNSMILANGPSTFVVTFGEALSTQNGGSGAHSVLNLANWQITDDGATIAGGINKVQYGLNQAYLSGLTSTPSNKYEAVVTFDGNSSVAGNQPLGSGVFKLTLSSAVQDTFGNALDGGYTGAPGSNFGLTFTVVAGDGDGGTTTPPGDPTIPTSDIVVSSYTNGATGAFPDVAADAVGNFVVVWNSNYYADGGDISLQRFNRFGQALGAEIIVTAHTTDGQGNIQPNGAQTGAAVAMDSFGDFVVVWSGEGIGDESGIFAQVFDKTGKVMGNAFRVNQTVVGVQDSPAVAMDANGDFVVTWTSPGESGDGDIYARRFTVQGAAATGDVLVNSVTANRQDNSAVAMDANGNFVVVWESDQQDGNAMGIFGQRFSAAGGKLGGTMPINTYTLDSQINPTVAMDGAGDFVVAWSSFGQDGSGYGVYARRYTPAGAAKDGQEFRVNATTVNWQITPDVDMANDGSFTVIWSAFGQDNITVSKPTYDYGIYAHSYNADGTNYKNTATGAALSEFRINYTTQGDQVAPAIAVSGNGRIAAVWTGPDIAPATGAATGRTDVFARVIVPGSESPSPAVVAEGPAISQVAVSLTKNKMSWNAADSDGVAGSSLMIDGAAVPNVGGPYAAPAGVYYSAPFGSLPAGNHSYTISATDKAGHTSSLAGTFTVPGTVNSGPAVSQVVVSQTKGRVSWNADDPDGVAGVALAIDGSAVSGIGGPYAAPTGAYFSGPLGSPAIGGHTYVITATDKAGNVSTFNGAFTVAAPPAGTGPTISQVAVSLTKNKMSWNAFDADGVSSVGLTIDGSAVSSVGGPYAAPTGAYYSSPFGSLTVGAHTYVIRATDWAGNVSTSSGSFTLTAPSNAAMSALYGQSLSALSNSAKVNWLYDLGGLLDSSSDEKNTSASAVDAVMAGY